MTDHTAENKRAAKNTLFLYLRMFLTMAVSLYTSRIILKVLGVEDYGIYNVVGGVISLFTFINSAMTNATQRYITFALGRGNDVDLSHAFCTSLNIHGLISLVILIVGETLGLWFVNTQLVIPVDRMVAANWVYQLSILSTIVMIMSTPYNALLIAHEKMSAFAYISIIEVLLRLFVVYLLMAFSQDKLIVYAILLFLLQLFIRMLYTMYCSRHFKESKYRFVHDKPLFKEMISFSAWSLWGNLSCVLSGQGVNMLLNMFFGPVVNAARAVAFQVQGAINGFSSNFQMALNPQITKNYAVGDMQQMHRLIYASSKYSFYLLFILSLPIALETPQLLSIWLTDVPENTVVFLRLTIIITIINAMAGPMTISAQANGNIKMYQAMVGGILLLSLPVSYIGLKIFSLPVVVYVAEIVIVAAALFVRLIFMRRMIRLSLRDYMLKVLLRVMSVAIVSFVPSFILYKVLPANIWSLIAVCMASMIFVASAIMLFGLTHSKKIFLVNHIKKFIRK